MVETVAAAVIVALTAGATDGVKDVVKQGLADAYGKLKQAITTRSSDTDEVSTALAQLEAKPTSIARQDVVKEELETSGLANDPQVLQEAKALLSLVSSLQANSSGSQIAHGTGIAQADRNSSASVTMSQGRK